MNARTLNAITLLLVGAIAAIQMSCQRRSDSSSGDASLATQYTESDDSTPTDGYYPIAICSEGPEMPVLFRVREVVRRLGYKSSFSGSASVYCVEAQCDSEDDARRLRRELGANGVFMWPNVEWPDGAVVEGLNLSGEEMRMVVDSKLDPLANLEEVLSRGRWVGKIEALEEVLGKDATPVELLDMEGIPQLRKRYSHLKALFMKGRKEIQPLPQ